MVIGQVVYSHTPVDWDQQRFLALGGFTVVFLNYNKALFIEKSVASALSQDFPLCEMFFMDDASTDDSGDVMERMVRAYNGRHKVTVIRNDENQHIVGQWNIVSKLATGNWFGMFCADDVAHVDRVTKARKIIERFPTLRGFSTNGSTRNIVTGRCDQHMCVTDLLLCTGKSDLYEAFTAAVPLVGATAFWRRDLFVDELPKGPMDDEVLHWILLAKAYGVEYPVYAWVGDVDTIEYTVGSGISSVQFHIEHPSKIAKMRQQLKRLKSYECLIWKTFSAVLDFTNEHKFPKSMVEIAECRLLRAEIILGNTYQRLLLIPRLLKHCFCSGVCPKWRHELGCTFLKFFMRGFFGDDVGANLRCHS